jgi:competence protein ComEA
MSVPSVPPRPHIAAEGLVERLRTWWVDPRVRVGVLLTAAVVVGLAWFQVGRAERPAPAGTAPAPRPASATSGAGSGSGSGATGATTTTTAAGSDLVIHVAGAVARPGIVRVRAGARVVDAIEAAGGGLPDAALDQLNLAAKVADGQRIAVARVGQPPPPEVGGATGTGTTSPGATGAPNGPVDLNTASQAELEALPGIGPALAQAILAYREEHGGFRSVGELQEVRGIGDGRFAQLSDLVTV